MNISTIGMPQAERVEVSEDTLTAVLSDGRTISVPLKWYPRLAHATAKERRNWRCTGGGIHWPDLNENLSVEALFAGRPRKEKQKSDKTKPAVLDEPALVEGRLMEVNWACGTAELHFIPQRVVPLRFDPVLNDDMRRLATQHVEIRGRGRFNDNDEWDVIYVEQITGTRSCSEPFDLQAFHNNPSPKIFDPEKVVTVSEPFDVDEFIRIIRASHDHDFSDISDLELIQAPAPS